MTVFSDDAARFFVAESRRRFEGGEEAAIKRWAIRLAWTGWGYFLFTFPVLFVFLAAVRALAEALLVYLMVPAVCFLAVGGLRGNDRWRDSRAALRGLAKGILSQLRPLPGHYPYFEGEWVETITAACRSRVIVHVNGKPTRRAYASLCFPDHERQLARPSVGYLAQRPLTPSEKDREATERFGLRPHFPELERHAYLKYLAVVLVASCYCYLKLPYAYLAGFVAVVVLGWVLYLALLDIYTSREEAALKADLQRGYVLVREDPLPLSGTTLCIEIFPVSRRIYKIGPKSDLL